MIDRDGAAISMGMGNVEEKRIRSLIVNQQMIRMFFFLLLHELGKFSHPGFGNGMVCCISGAPAGWHKGRQFEHGHLAVDAQIKERSHFPDIILHDHRTHGGVIAPGRKLLQRRNCPVE